MTFHVPVVFTVQSLNPSGLEIVQCRLQSQFVAENCRSRTECRTDVSGYLRTDTRTVLGQFLWRKATFGGKNDLRPVYYSWGVLPFLAPDNTNGSKTHRSFRYKIKESSQTPLALEQSLIMYQVPGNPAQGPSWALAN